MSITNHNDGTATLTIGDKSYAFNFAEWSLSPEQYRTPANTEWSDGERISVSFSGVLQFGVKQIPADAWATMQTAVAAWLLTGRAHTTPPRNLDSGEWIRRLRSRRFRRLARKLRRCR